MEDIHLHREIDLVTGKEIWYDTYQDEEGNWWKNPISDGSIFFTKTMETERRKQLHQLLDKMIDNNENEGVFAHAELISGTWTIVNYKLSIEKEEKNL